MVDAAVNAFVRNANRDIELLGLNVGRDETPSPSEGGKIEGWWNARCEFSGTVWSFNAYNEIDQSRHVEISGFVEICISKDRFLAVLQMDDGALWIGAASVMNDPEKQDTHGKLAVARDLLGGKGESMTLESRDWTMDLVDVSRVWQSAGIQDAQAESLIKAIGNMEPREPLPPPVAANPRSEKVWIREESLGDLYRLYVGGEPTSASSFVDRGKSKEAQVEELKTLKWVPDWTVRKVTEATSRSKLRDPYRGALPEKRAALPFHHDLGVIVGQGDDTHPVFTHIWPTFHDDGTLVTEGDEKEIGRWDFERVLRGGTILDESTYIYLDEGFSFARAKLLLTDRRLVATGHEDTRGRDYPPRQWAMHIRHEWVSEVGTIHYGLPIKGLFKKQPREYLELFFVSAENEFGQKIEPRFLVENSAMANSANDQYQSLLRNHLGRKLQEGESTFREFGAPNVRPNTEDRTAFRVEGSVPISLPTRLR